MEIFKIHLISFKYSFVPTLLTLRTKRRTVHIPPARLAYSGSAPRTSRLVFLWPHSSARHLYERTWTPYIDTSRKIFLPPSSLAFSPIWIKTSVILHRYHQSIYSWLFNDAASIVSIWYRMVGWLMNWTSWWNYGCHGNRSVRREVSANPNETNTCINV